MKPVARPIAGEVALKSDIPKVATAKPMAEMTGGKPGADPMTFDGYGHSHPRITETLDGTLSAGGTATIVFDKAYDKMPTVDFIEIGTGTNISWSVVWTLNASKQYVGCTVYGRRTRKLPAVISLLSALTNYDPSEVAPGASFVGFLLPSSKTA